MKKTIVRIGHAEGLGAKHLKRSVLFVSAPSPLSVEVACWLWNRKRRIYFGVTYWTWIVDAMGFYFVKV